MTTPTVLFVIGGSCVSVTAWTPGSRGDAPAQFLVHRRRALRRVARVARVGLEPRHALDLVAQTLVACRGAHLHERAGGGEHHDRGGDLEHHEPVPQREPATPRRPRLSVPADDRQQVEARGVECRREAEQHARDHGQHDGKGEHSSRRG